MPDAYPLSVRRRFCRRSVRRAQANFHGITFLF
jgi:hypothetical protein